MSMKTFHRCVRLLSLLILATAWVRPLLAEPPAASTPGRAELALPKADPMALPAKLVRIVIESPKAEQQQTAVAVTRYVVENMPNLALVVLRAIVEAAPETGPEVAATAAKLKPQWLRTIARTLAATVPQQADRLIYRLCKVYPFQFDQITIAVCQGAPQVTPQYLSAVSEAVPGIKSILDRQLQRQIKAAFTPALVISVVTMTLAEVNSAANLITSTLNNLGGGLSVSFADVASAILQNQIQIAGNGTIASIDTQAISSPSLQQSLSQPGAQTTVASTIALAVNNPNSAYGGAVAGARVPAQVIDPRTAVIVPGTTPRDYSKP